MAAQCPLAVLCTAGSVLGSWSDRGEVGGVYFDVSNVMIVSSGAVGLAYEVITLIGS